MRLFKRKKTGPIYFKESAIAHQFLDGLNGIEIGGNTQNSFGLETSGGGYANVDFDATQGAKWQTGDFPSKLVNIVADGDNLPFKDNSLDYVISSHVLEHFFDPIQTIKEWLRVVHPGGYVFFIVPHKERTYDKQRPVTSVQELKDRHEGRLKPEDYLIMTIPELSTTDLPADYMKQYSGKDIPEGYERLTKNSHRHQTVWNYYNMLELCHEYNFNVIYSAEIDDKVGSGFTVILQK